jgi:integrative and conjugative element protein (TIGR02256 family)
MQSMFARLRGWLSSLSRSAGTSYVVWIPYDEWARLLSDANSWSPDETGGVLMGYRREREIVLTNVIMGGPLAERSEDGFVPDGRWQADRVAAAYAASERRTTYLGDWHTHTHLDWKPSARDRQTAERIARASEARASEPLMLIVARQDREWTPKCFIRRSGKLKAATVRFF